MVKKIVYYIKKQFNWEAFFISFLICSLGALSNKSAKTLLDCGLLILIFGMPFSIIMGAVGAKDKE